MALLGQVSIGDLNFVLSRSFRHAESFIWIFHGVTIYSLAIFLWIDQVLFSRLGVFLSIFDGKWTSSLVISFKVTAVVGIVIGFLD